MRPFLAKSVLSDFPDQPQQPVQNRDGVRRTAGNVRVHGKQRIHAAFDIRQTDVG